MSLFADHRSYRANLTFVIETAEKSVAVIGGATHDRKLFGFGIGAGGAALSSNLMS